MKTLKIKSFTDYYKNNECYSDDSGFDLYVPKDITIEPFKDINKGTLIDLQIQCEMKEYDCNLGYYLYPRSSIYKTPLRLSNSVGIIDAGYRGNIMASVDNHSSESYTIKKGTRLFQICSGDLSIFNTIILDDDEKLSVTIRGQKGLGSTGN
tara:strand:- start:1092 stop:1547 length:456 start_codon:yes stop_codon:yes gene_type:complete